MWTGLRLRTAWLQEMPLRRALSTGRSRNVRFGPRGSINRPQRIQPVRRNAPNELEESTPSPSDAPNPDYDPSQNTLLSPVHIPEDANAVLKENHPATNLLANSGLVVQRQLEMMTVMVGFEQANKYVIMDAQGNHIGYMAEQEKGISNTMARQMFRTRRSFVTHVFDRHENEVLRFHRPFSWINSQIKVYDPLDVTTSAYSSSTALQNTTPGSLVSAGNGSNTRISPLSFDEMRIIGEAQSQWAPLRRKYNLFTYHQSPNPATDMGTQTFPLSGSNLSNAQQMQLAETSNQGSGEFNQFAYVDEPWLSWNFHLRSAENQLIGSVNRDFSGFAREIFTDTGVYALRMDSASLGTQDPETTSVQPTGMTLDQRAVMLATAVSVDFDYFSRQSSAGGFGFMPLWFPGMGGEAAGGAAGGAVGGAAGEAGAAGAIGEAATGAVGPAGAMGGMTDGMATGVAGAGAMAGYEAMQRGMPGGQDGQAASPEQQPDISPYDQHSPQQSGFYEDSWPEQHQNQNEEVWGQEDPWKDQGGDGGEGSDFSDWF
ncbi:hypothetical protein N7493_010349 [Penicillium malachiteum]|uniref:Scramblase n=1 Tax=Penicillium malachiteum TaxID=1324776 RepID=A0AAD6HCW9_9EURO|nr:hypothetical protein N7493_010349 [Penicillium malachiteum]